MTHPNDCHAIDGIAETAREAGSTLSGLLTARADAAPDDALYTWLDDAGGDRGTTRAGALHRRAGAVTAALTAHAVRRGEPVLVCAAADADYLAALFGCFGAGAAAVPVYPPAGPAADAAIDGIARVVLASGARVLLAPKAIGAALVDRLLPRLGAETPTLCILPADGAAVEVAPMTEAGPDDAAVILYTSGSTGDPKGVILTHGAIARDMASLVARCFAAPDSRPCTWLPHAHVAGLYTLLIALELPRGVVAMPPAAFTGDPRRWLRAIARHRCTYTVAPDFAYGLLAAVVTDDDLVGLDLSCWTLAISGGERIRASTSDAVVARLKPAGIRWASLHPYYGMTETLCTSVPAPDAVMRLSVSRDGIDRGRFRRPTGPDDVLELFGNGPPLDPETAVCAVNPENGQPCPKGWIGELWMRGPTVTPGYHREPELTARVAGARMADGSGPWFRTGDMGLVHDGQVFVTGRLKEMLIVRGRNHHPTDLEETVQRSLGLAEQRCAAFTVLADGLEALGLAIEVDDMAEDGAGAFDVVPTLRAARRAIARGHGLTISQLYFVPPGTLPRTSSNKLSRQRCRSLAESGAWDAWAATTARRTQEQQATLVGELALDGLSGAPLRDALRPAIRGVFAEDDAGGFTALADDAKVADLGLDSLQVAHVARRMRALTGHEPPFAALFDGSDLRALIERTAALLEGDREGAGDVTTWRTPVRAIACALPDVMPPLRTRPGSILLTGGTGFLGRYLLAELLRQSARPLLCLVRARDDMHAMQRVIDAMRDGPGWQDDWHDRIEAIPGDIIRPQLGLSDGMWARLHAEVATVVHNAANVNFVAPYAALAPINVAPLRTITALVALGDELKTLHLVSTLAVFNATQRREQRHVQSIDHLLKPDFHYSGYAQTKWVAEACVEVLGSRGVPVGKHRPGVITGHSQSGHLNADDFLCRLIQGCVALGRYPDSLAELDLVTVDDVAEGIAATVDMPLTYVDTFHWSAGRRGTRLTELMEILRARGHAMQPEPLQQWLDRIRTALPEDNPLFPLHPFLLEIPADSDETILEHFDGLPLNVQTTEADAVRAAKGLEHKPVDAAVIHRIAARLERDGILEAPR